MTARSPIPGRSPLPARPARARSGWDRRRRPTCPGRASRHRPAPGQFTMSPSETWRLSPRPARRPPSRSPAGSPSRRRATPPSRAPVPASITWSGRGTPAPPGRGARTAWGWRERCRPAPDRCGAVSGPACPPAPEILEYLPGRVPARRAHRAAAGVGAGAAHIKVTDGRPVPGPSPERPHGEQLVQRHVAVTDVATGEPVDLLEAQRGQHLAVDDRPADVRSVLGERVESQISQFLPPGSPVSLGGPVRDELHGDRHHVVACRRQGVVDRGGDDHIEIGPARRSSGPEIVKGLLEVGRVRAASATAWAMPPIAPLTKPQAPGAPLASPR